MPQFFRRISFALFSLLFPDECRICQKPLREVRRYPVCDECIRCLDPFVAEYFCASCHTPFLNPRPLDENGLCGVCRRGMRPYDSVYCFGSYEGSLRTLIHLYKYSRMRALAHPLGSKLASALPAGQRYDVIVPVPLHWWRRWRRGFNQSELLGQEVARRCAAPVINALKRKRATTAQAGLSHAGRRSNVTGAFAVKKRSLVEGKTVLLIDDVLTTGATAAACAASLKRAGASHVAVLTLARVDRRPATPEHGAPRQSTFAGVGEW